jgi:hypothetical protein
MLRWFWKRVVGFVSRHVVADEPVDTWACTECEACTCSEEQFQTCPRRLAALGSVAVK